MILHGDCLDQLKNLSDNSVDSVVTDPPYGWRFMGKAWDGADIDKVAKAKERGGVMADGRTRAARDLPAESAGTYDQSLEGNEAFCAWTEIYARELLRVMKPGAHALIFCGPRTYHAMAMGVERAGFEIRDQLQWLFGSGFPKSHNIGNGIGTALKPANEPIVLARKPLEKGLTVAENVLKWGVGGLNIDVSRIASENNEHFRALVKKAPDSKKVTYEGQAYKNEFQPTNSAQGRWPANLILDETAAEMLDEQSGERKSRGEYKNFKPTAKGIFQAGVPTAGTENKYANETGGASRFFYVAKASKRERNAGMGEQTNGHPTVKPLKLMEYLIKLITPPQSTVLDPFMGSGSTGVAAVKNGFKFIGIEMNEEYVEIAKRRITNG